MLQLPILGFYSSGIDVCKCTPLKLNPQSMIRPRVSIPLFPRCTLYMFSGFSGGVWLGCTRTARLYHSTFGPSPGRWASFLLPVLRTENTPSPKKMNKHQEKLGGGNSNIFSVSPLLGGIDPIRLIFFGWVETTNYRKQMQLMHSHCVSFLPVPRSCFSFVMYVWANTKVINLSEKIQVLRRYNFMRPVSVVNNNNNKYVWCRMIINILFIHNIH